MNTRQILLSIVALDFLAFSLWVVADQGFIGMFETLLSTWSGVQVLADLSIALTMILVWMVVDARRRGIAALPFIVATLALGSIGPLAYLVRREWTPR